MLPLPVRAQKFVEKIVILSRVVFGIEPVSTLTKLFLDHLYFLHPLAPSFFEQMWMIDPVGNGDCGFHVLQLFSIFMDGDNKRLSKNDPSWMKAIRSTKTLRWFIINENDQRFELLQGKQYYGKYFPLSLHPTSHDSKKTTIQNDLAIAINADSKERGYHVRCQDGISVGQKINVIVKDMKSAEECRKTLVRNGKSNNADRSLVTQKFKYFWELYLWKTDAKEELWYCHLSEQKVLQNRHPLEQKVQCLSTKANRNER
jgi:hypothetical protein